MALGVSGGNDFGVTPEIQLQEAARMGNEVLRVTNDRFTLKIDGKSPTIPFLDPSKFSQEYVSGLKAIGQIDQQTIDGANKASLGLSLEAAMQVVGARPRPGSQVVETIESLQEIGQLLSNCGRFVSSENDRHPELLVDVAREVSRKGNLQVEDEKLVAWAKDCVAKSQARINTKVEQVRDYLR